MLRGCSGSSPMISPFFSFFLAMREFKEMMGSVKVWGSISKSNHPTSKGSVGIELFGRYDKSKFGQALPIKWAFCPVYLWCWEWNRGCCLKDFIDISSLLFQVFDFRDDGLKFWVWLEFRVNQKCWVWLKRRLTKESLAEGLLLPIILDFLLKGLNSLFIRLDSLLMSPLKFDLFMSELFQLLLNLFNFVVICHDFLFVKKTKKGTRKVCFILKF